MFKPRLVCSGPGALVLLALLLIGLGYLLIAIYGGPNG
jgi:hypothetical protein